MEVREFIRAYIEDGKTIISSVAPAKETFSSSATPLEELDETSQKLSKLLKIILNLLLLQTGGISF